MYMASSAAATVPALEGLGLVPVTPMVTTPGQLTYVGAISDYQVLQAYAEIMNDPVRREAALAAAIVMNSTAGQIYNGL